MHPYPSIGLAGQSRGIKNEPSRSHQSYKCLFHNYNDQNRTHGGVVTSTLMPFAIARKQEVQETQVHIYILSTKSDVVVHFLPCATPIFASGFPMLAIFQMCFSNSSRRDHTSSVERFCENFDDKAVTYLIFFIGTH